MSLSNVLVIGLFRSNSRMVIFSKTEKNSYHSKHVRDHTFMTSIWKVDVHIKGKVLKFVTCLYILFFFKQKIYCVHFCLQMKVVGVTKLVIFCCHHKFITPKWFKITTNSTNRGSSFFCNIKPQAGYILTA